MSMQVTNKVRVLVVDDSALMRKIIPQMLEADQSIEVVGTAMDGSFCLKKIEELQAQRGHSRSADAGHERHRHFERDHAPASDAGDRGQLAQHRRRISHL